MTPDDAISAAFRAASKELDRQPVQVEAYETFLLNTSEHLDLAAQFLTQIAEKREAANDETLASLEQCGLREILQASVSGLLALAHYPYLNRITMQGERLI